MRFHPPFCSLEEYTATRSERVPTYKLQEHCIYTAMVELVGRGPEALRMPASITDVQQVAGSLAVLLCLKKPDFSDLVQNKGQVADGLWTPDPRDLFIIGSPYGQILGVEGYFLPYDDEIDRTQLHLEADQPRELVGAGSGYSPATF